MWKLKQFIPKEPVGLEGRTIDIGRTKVQVRNVIAEGGFSCVYLALDVVHPSKQYALKHIICNDEESLSLVMKEISVMKLLKGHQNVVTLAASDIFDMGRRKEAFLLMDFCEKSLVSVLESRGAGYYDEKQILLIFRDACNAVFAMHCQSPPIAHRDLKAENLLLGSDGTWKLCDFGSTSTNHKCFDKLGEMGIEEDNIRKYTTPAYRPPEMWDLYRKEVISEKVDIWALGCLLYRICYFKSAFDGESKLQILNGNYRIPDLPKYSSSITDLIKDMLQASPDARPDVTQVWFRVNLQLPQELQKETPDGSLLTAMPDMHMPTIYVHDEGSTRRTPVMPRRSPPPPPSTRESHRISPQHVMEEQQHRASVIAPKASDKDGPLGMFWTTQYATDRQVMEDKGPLFDEEPVRKTISKQSVQNHEKWHSPPRGRQPPKKTDWGNPINKSNEDPSLDFEIRFDTDDDGSGKKRASHFDNEKTKVSGNNSTFQNDAFNTFVAEFDTTKLTPSTSSRISGKEIEAEVESLKDQLKQSNKEKTEITSKYEKLSAICRSQRQEIQELKQALATANQFLSNKDNLNNQSTASSLSYSPQRREKIEGSVLELQGGMLVNASPKANPDQKEWQPFTDEPKSQPKSKMNRPKSVRTTGSRPSSKQPNAGQSNESWGFDYESFTADPTSSRISKATTSSIQGSTSQRYNSSEVKKVETTQPAGWAGF